MTREEAIEIIKRNCINGSLMHEACELLLPELFESEDERIRKRIRLCLEECVHSDIIRDYESSECLAWLERQKEHKPAEWSEEDKSRVKQLIYDTEHIRAEYEKRKKELGESFNDELIKDCDEKIAWLKSLRPDGYKNCNSRWKPSEGQMDTLKTVYGYFVSLRNVKTSDSLRSLYDNLKKLL